MYFLAIISVIVATGLVCLMTALGAGGMFVAGRMFDLSVVLMLILFFIPLLVSSGLWKDFNNAFRLGIGKKKAESLMELKKAKEATGLSIRILLSETLLIAAVQCIQILYNMDDLMRLGPNIAVLALTVIYGMGITMILLPLQSILHIKIQEYINGQE